MPDNNEPTPKIKPLPLTQIPITGADALYLSRLIGADLQDMSDLRSLGMLLEGPMPEDLEKEYHAYWLRATDLRIRMLAVVSLDKQGLLN